MAQGMVKWYDPATGQGVIVPDGGGDDVFVQRAALLGEEPIPGDRVTFSLQPHPGGPVAQQVQIIAPGDDAGAPAQDQIVVPVYEERLTATTHDVDLGEVLIHTHTETEPVHTSVDATHDELSVERVPINRPVDVVPQPRIDDDVIIVPIVAEEVVTTKRLILNEELHIRRRRVTETVPIQESVRRQVVDVKGYPAPGATSAVESIPQSEPPAPPNVGRHE